MRLHRFYTKEELREGKSLRTEDAELIHQLKDVFRMKKADSVILFNGNGFEYESRIELLSKKEAVFTIGKREAKQEKGSGAHLFISIIKKDKFELAIEKATELGVSKITPIIAERSQYKTVRKDRLEKIVQEASEQSGRVTVPEITLELPLEVALEQYPGMTVLDMDGQEKGIETKNVLVGPEGGWSEKEQELFREKGITVKSLPFNTLRAETAVIAVLSRSV